ncbi:tyrosine-type recombinase/integrase [Staphylococcus sp. 17KM0847]|uniref:tyrosine-type recombinase/integrase n=1 Tax=Staphylococcus sp. 17KM0847 TaxID=2583989 RepID=UPI0015DBF56B|nr:tyrosine-type recombinase/integrase [Staphylococcus sp. 17KM0847]QLK85416.1 integrase [Staphylococcus sp. 17KM0847]
MNCVDPIREREDIQKMYMFLRTQSMRDYLLFKLAIHTGVKLNVLLNLTVYDVLDEAYDIVVGWKTCETQGICVVLPERLREELKAYIVAEHLEVEDLLFQSKRTKKGLSRQQAYRIIHAAAVHLGIPHIGLTTLRKTFAYHTYRSGISITTIQKYLGHQTVQETWKFIGVDRKAINTIIALDL